MKQMFRVEKLKIQKKEIQLIMQNATAMNGNTMMKVIMDKSSIKMNGQPLPPAMG